MAESQAVILDLSGSEYGIPADCVREIVRLVEITPVPESQAFIMGAIDYRGAVAIVIDLALRLGLEASPHTLSTQIIIVESEAGLTGLVVDRVSDVINIDAAAVLKGRDTGLDDDITTGAYEDGDRLILLLDINRVLEYNGKRVIK